MAGVCRVNSAEAEGCCPVRGCTDNNACAQMKDMRGNKIPPTPLYKRGAFHGIFYKQTPIFPLF
jgi:hypothetical protein